MMTECRSRRSGSFVHGFTLIELLVVIVIIAILAALAIPVIGKMKIAGQKTESISRLRNIYPMFQAYAADHQGRLPPGYSSARNREGEVYGTWTHRLNQEGYVEPKFDNVKKAEIFGCPRQLDQFTPKNGDLRTYAMNMRIGDHPTSKLQGARRTVTMEHLSNTALLLNGPWTGTNFSNATYENYKDRMKVDGEPYTVFGDGVLVMFADGHVAVRDLEDEIPRSINTEEGRDFWMGGIIERK